MRLSELPGLPRLYADFVGGSTRAFAILGSRPDVESLVWRAQGNGRTFPRDAICGLLQGQAARYRSGDKTLRNIDRLVDSRTRIVVCIHNPDMIGGPLANLIQALSAAKLAEALTVRGVPSIPMLWFAAGAESCAPENAVGILDGRSSFQTLSRQHVKDDCDENRFQWMIPETGPALERLRDVPMFSDLFEEIHDDRAAWGRVISALAAEQGLVVVDPALDEWRALGEGLLKGIDSAQDLSEAMRTRYGQLHSAGYALDPDDPQGGQMSERLTAASDFPLILLLIDAMLPIGAIVLHPTQCQPYALMKPVLHRFGSNLPPAWPRASVSIVDARSRKIMKRYGIGLADMLKSGNLLPEQLAPIEHGSAVVSRISRLESVLNSRISDVLARSGAESGAEAAIRDAETRIEYQLGKLRRRFCEAFSERRTVICRQMERVMNTLAPGGRLQEDRIWGLHFVLNYSPGIVGRLWDEVDVLRFEHRRIDVN